MKRIAFIRDDDVYKIDRAFMGLFDFCLKKEIPVIYGVIPKKATPDLIKLLNKTKNKYPHLVDIVQHGWQHKNYNRDLTNKPCANALVQGKYEFGPRRSYLQQKKDIEKGLNKMLKSFGKNFTPAFIPPYHGYNNVTLRIINELGFRIFSAGSKIQIEDTNLLDFPAVIDLNDYAKTGRPLFINTLSLVKKVRGYMNSNRPLLGMVFHHKVLTNKSKLTQIHAFLLFLKNYARKEYVRITLFSHHS